MTERETMATTPRRRELCAACGCYCRSLRDCLERTNSRRHTSGNARTITITPLGWASSKYGRDPRKDR